MFGEIHNGHREELEKGTLASGGRTENFLKIFPLREVSRRSLNEDCLQPMMSEASESKARAFNCPEGLETLEEGKKLKEGGKGREQGPQLAASQSHY